MCTELDTQCARTIHGILYIYLTGLSNRCDCFFFFFFLVMPIVYKNVFLYFLLSSAQILTGVRTWCTDIGEFSERCNSRYTTSMSYWAPKETTRGNSQDAASSLYTERMRYIFDTLVNGYFPILTYRMLSNINTERGVYRCVDGNIPFMLYTIYFSFFSVVMVVGWRKSRFNLVEGLFFESFFEVLPRCMKFPFLINAISIPSANQRERKYISNAIRKI